MRLDDLDYKLPPDRIATVPATPRESAKLMVVRVTSGDIEHARVGDLPDLLSPEDLVVRNRSRVLPARLEAVRVDSGGRVGGLFLGQRDDGCWTALLQSNGKLRLGIRLKLAGDGPSLELTAREGPAWEPQEKDHNHSRKGTCSVEKISPPSGRKAALGWY